jgi:DNA-binding CsgD family transcriptional regulator
VEDLIGDVAGVYGRAAELARIRSFLQDAATGPAALLVEGAVGIGKTTLWSAGIDLARQRGWWVLTCRPVQSEAVLSFSALGDLLEPVAEEAFAGLPRPQRQALDVALLRADPGPEPPDQRAVAVALLGVIRALAESAPVIIGVDDLPWLDRSSAAVVEYALRRLTTQRVGLLATVTGADPPVTFLRGGLGGGDAPLAWWFPPERLRSIQVGPLSLEAVDAVLRARSYPPASWPEVVEVHEASGGNPYFALELAAALVAAGRRRGAGQPLPVPGSLRPLVQRRLTGLSPVGRDVALLVAAAANPTVETILAACGGGQDAQDGLDSAGAAGVLQIAGGRVRFAHPLLRSLHYSSATEEQRRWAHRCLARVTGEAEGKVRHLALAADEPDEWLAGRLAAAARVACLRGAAVTGAELADLALRLTPPGNMAARAERLMDAGQLHLAAFDPAGARELLEEAIGLSDPGQLRATALQHLAQVTGYLDGVAAALPLLRRALAEAGDGTVLKALVHRDLCYVIAVSNESFVAATANHLWAAFDIARRTGDDGLVSQLLTFQVVAEFVTGHGIRCDLIKRALERRHQGVRVPIEMRPRVLCSHVLRSGDDLQGAIALLTEEYAEAAEQGAETDLPFVILHLVELEIWAGNFSLAADYAEHGYRVALAAGAPTPTACMHSARAIVRAFRGPLDEARAEAGLAIESGLQSGVYYLALLGSHALGLVELVSGDPTTAHAILGKVTAAVAGRELVDPGWIAQRTVPDDIEALIRLGDLAAAEALLVSLEERAQRLDRAWALATAGRCRALLMSARGDHDAAFAAVQQAFIAHGRLDMPFELARTHLAAGDVARRARRKVAAQEHLEKAQTVFTRLGAVPWAQRAGADLARLGMSRADGVELTRAERQVAGLVAAGRTNRETAAELYMAVRTVEAHLSAIYRKLGVRSRSELARAWAERPGLKQ